MAGGFITLLDVSILNVSIPSISATLHMGATGVQAIMAGYSLVFGLVLVPAGRLGDVYGRRRLFIIGLLVFGVASVGCGLAGSAGWLIALRLLQGAGAALVNPQMLGITQQLFSGATRARAFGYLGLIIGVATAIGPTLGGLLIAAFGPEGGWRAAFLVNVPIILVVWPLAARFLPAHEDTSSHNLGLDAVGLSLLAISVLALMAPFLIASNHTIGLSGAPWYVLLVAVVAAAACAWWERRAEAAGRSVIAPRRLIRTPSFTLGTLTQALYAAGFTALFVIYTLYLQQGLGLAAWQAGLMQLPIALASGVAAPLAGRWVATLGRPLVVAGTALVTVSALGLGLVAHAVPAPGRIWAVGVVAALLGVGSGLTMTPNQALAVEDIPVATGSTAGGLFQTLQRVGSAVGITVVTLAFYSALTPADVTGQAGHRGEAFAWAFTYGTLAIAAFTALAGGVAALDAWRVRRR